MKTITSTILLLLSSTTEGFLSIPSFAGTNHGRDYSSSLSAAEGNSDEDFLSTRRESVIKASSAILASTAILNSQIANAEDDSGAPQGRLIEFQVENLGGEPGNSGRFVIKTNPEWAPNGVKR